MRRLALWLTLLALIALSGRADAFVLIGKIGGGASFCFPCALVPAS